MKGYIYTLSDPITNQVRYIGQTRNIENRLNMHLERCVLSNTHKNSWISSLLKQNYIPIIEILEECDIQDMNFLEIFYISLFKSWNFKLTNMTNGGEGGVPDLETRLKISKSKLGKKWSDKTREIMKNRIPGRTNSVLSEESKKKIREKTKETKSSIEGRTKLMNAAFKRRTYERPSIEVLSELMKTNSTQQIAEMYNTTANNIYKLRRIYGITRSKN